jgi:phosphoribosylamine--glycine ligase
VLASGGYPGKYTTGYEISGVEDSDGIVFHAGTKLAGQPSSAGNSPESASSKTGATVTAGGRVLGVTALGSTLAEAVDAAYKAAAPIKFENMHFRHDIGRKI